MNQNLKPTKRYLKELSEISEEFNLEKSDNPTKTLSSTSSYKSSFNNSEYQESQTNSTFSSKKIKSSERKIQTNIKIMRMKNRMRKLMKKFNTSINHYKNEAFEKFNYKLCLILSFFRKINLNFDDMNLPENENPIKLLYKVLKAKNINKKKEFIERIDFVLSSL